MGVVSNLDRYRRVARLGSGGMSTVELAEDTLLGRRVALKRMHTPDDVSAHSRLRREALIGASLTHPNLVSIFDILTTEDGDDVIVMEYVEGETLADTLRQGAQLDRRRAMEILTGVGAALDTIHDDKVVHRDVKPANILLGVDGSIKLADLGIAAMADRTRITTAGAVLGTFSYMAPEQLEGAVATPAADVYALSAVAYEVLSGQKARNEPNPVALAHAISTQPPPDIRGAWPEAPAEVAEVLIGGMSRDPRERPRSAGELTAQLKAALEPEPTEPIRRQPDPVPPPRSAQPAPGAPPQSVPAPSARPDPSPPSAAPVPRRAARPPRRGPPPARSRTGSSRRGVLVAAALALAAVVAVIVVATSGGSNHRATSAASLRKPAAANTTSSGSSAVTPSSSTSSSATSAGSAAPTGAAATSGVPGAGTPVGAVVSFYHLAAAHQYAPAWALADPAFRSQLGGYPSFQSGQAGDRSITFNDARVVSQSGDSATVAVRTTSVRDNGTQRCSGTVDLVRGASSSWLLHQIRINCA